MTLGRKNLLVAYRLAVIKHCQMKVFCQCSLWVLSFTTNASLYLNHTHSIASTGYGAIIPESTAGAFQQRRLR